MAPVTPFAVKEKYEYLYGLGNYHQSEAVAGAIPLVNNSPQQPPYGLRTERISGTSFTAPREHSLQTWMYRVTPSLRRGEFTEYAAPQTVSAKLSPNSYLWPAFGAVARADWLQHKLLARNGDPATKTGVALWVFNVGADMGARVAFASLDGDALVIPHAGALDVQTELGRLLVRQGEVAVIPRGLRYRVGVVAGRPACGYICELFQGHFRLPALGAVGSTGLANARDFQIPMACFDGAVVDGVAEVAHEDDDGGDWTIISRLNGQLWSCEQSRTPFNIVAWHGTNYPYKYDLARFCVMGNALFDEHDPSLFVVLTAPSYREPGTAVVDFAIVPPRWNVSEETLWLPYFHRNAMSEFFGPIITTQDPEHPFNSKDADGFAPLGTGVFNSMAPHGAAEDDYQKATKMDTKPAKVQDDGWSIFLLETEVPLFLSEWAEKSGIKNFGAGAKRLT